MFVHRFLCLRLCVFVHRFLAAGTMQGEVVLSAPPKEPATADHIQLPLQVIRCCAAAVRCITWSEDGR